MEFNHLDGGVKPPGLPNFGQMARDRAARRGRERVLVAVQNAIKNDKISLVYQPVVYGRDAQKVVYYEGLIRVPDKRGRLIPRRPVHATGGGYSAGTDFGLHRPAVGVGGVTGRAEFMFGDKYVGAVDRLSRLDGGIKSRFGGR